MAHPSLVFGGALPEGPTVGRIEEERVIAEAVGTASGVADETLHRLDRFEKDVAITPHGSDRAREPRASLLGGQTGQLLEQESIAVGVRRPFPAEARRVEARAAVE